MTRSLPLVIAIYPTAKGFGWVIFEAPLCPVDWGTARSGRARNAKLVSRFERLCSRYKPDVLVLEDAEDPAFSRTARLRALSKDLNYAAAARCMSVQVFRRHQILEVFAPYGAKTRYEIAEYLSSEIDALKCRKPKRRKIWENLDQRQSLFDAAALARSYFFLRAAFLEIRGGNT